jgi:sigma-E factor negative regulatory protein RseA
MNPTDDQARRARLSAVMDGQADEAELQRWLKAEAPQAAVREDWHAYHLIGDVLRSPDLATTSAAHDHRLLQVVREGIQAQAVVMAPAALEAASPTRTPRPRWRLWGAAAAALAGVAVVLSAYLITRVEPVTWGSVVASMVEPIDNIRRASEGAATRSAASGLWPGTSAGQPAGGEASSASASSFREILRLPRGPAGQPQQSVQLLYSNGFATISVVVEPYRAGEHVPRTESSERLNTLSVQRQGNWLTLTGDVPLGTLQQMALSLPPQP